VNNPPGASIDISESFYCAIPYRSTPEDIGPMRTPHSSFLGLRSTQNVAATHR
jgi:hypothetical protein